MKNNIFGEERRLAIRPGSRELVDRLFKTGFLPLESIYFDDESDGHMNFIALESYDDPGVFVSHLREVAQGEAFGWYMNKNYGFDISEDLRGNSEEILGTIRNLCASPELREFYLSDAEVNSFSPKIQEFLYGDVKNFRKVLREVTKLPILVFNSDFAALSALYGYEETDLGGGNYQFNVGREGLPKEYVVGIRFFNWI